MDMFIRFEDIERDDDMRGNFMPLLHRLFRYNGFCCHIDNKHHVEAKNRVSSLSGLCREGWDRHDCSGRLQHRNIFKILIEKGKFEEAMKKDDGKGNLLLVMF